MRYYQRDICNLTDWYNKIILIIDMRWRAQDRYHYHDRIVSLVKFIISALIKIGNIKDMELSPHNLIDLLICKLLYWTLYSWHF